MTVTAPPARDIPVRRKVVYAVVTVVLVAGLGLGALLVLDIYLHHRVQDIGGVNVWGYRGPVIGKKKPGETRIVAIGGSTVFGFGLPASASWPAYLSERLNSHRTGGPITVVNLGVPSDSARTFLSTMDDYGYLQYDVVMMYEGYNDLGLDIEDTPQNIVIDDPEKIPAAPQGGRRHFLGWRHQSPVFRWTGYFPIFPLVLREKAMALLHGGDLDAAYKSRQIVFRPGLAVRATAGAMEAAADVAAKLEQRFGSLSADDAFLSKATDPTCGRWANYCGATAEAVQHGLDHGQRVIVITQPYISDLHIDQQRALAANLRRRFAGNPQFRYVDLGRLIDLRDSKLAYDGMHLTAEGNRIVAGALEPAVSEMIK